MLKHNLYAVGKSPHGCTVELVLAHRHYSAGLGKLSDKRLALHLIDMGRNVFSSHLCQHIGKFGFGGDYELSVVGQHGKNHEVFVGNQRQHGHINHLYRNLLGEKIHYIILILDTGNGLVVDKVSHILLDEYR